MTKLVAVVALVVLSLAAVVLVLHIIQTIQPSTVEPMPSRGERQAPETIVENESSHLHVIGYALETDYRGRLTDVAVAVYNPTDSVRNFHITARANGHTGMSYGGMSLLQAGTTQTYVVPFALPVDLSNVKTVRIRLIDQDPPLLPRQSLP